jgi:hypothetical protein
MAQEIASVSISTGAELLDVSRYGGNGWRTRIAGLKDLGGSCVAFLSKGATGTSPFNLSTTGASMTILFDTGCSIVFNAIIGNTQIVGEYQGLNIVTFSFSKADDQAPTILWATT